MTQNEMIYDYLKKNGSITTYEAFTELFITRLSARIYDIKKMYNLDIKEEWITKKNRYGKSCSFKKYILDKGE
ncbi:MAG TPA: hypothetical protein IAC14_08845 [Candidatus Scybalomonas excrementigallinarum]|nr:hypothetical protein [Candidatus Scybalomonas excrementigallinarum]